jgi:hypothetical protein
MVPGVRSDYQPLIVFDSTLPVADVVIPMATEPSPEGVIPSGVNGAPLVPAPMVILTHGNRSFKQPLGLVALALLISQYIGCHIFLAEANEDPRPFVWTKDPENIIAAVKRGHQVLDSIQ